MSSVLAESPLEKATTTLSTLPATTSTADKLTKVTGILNTITAHSPQLNTLIATSNKLLFDNRTTATLSLQDQDLLKTPQYAAYKAAAIKVNTLIPVGSTTAIIWV